MMDIRRKRGYALALIMLLGMVLITAVWGTYSYVRYFGRGIWLQDVEYTRGYYISLSGLRYAWILLKDPSAIPFDPETGSYTVSGNKNSGSFFTDALGSCNGTLTITITKITGGANNGQYNVSASYAG